jgi:hypothetical protein
MKIHEVAVKGPTPFLQRGSVGRQIGQDGRKYFELGRGSRHGVGISCFRANDQNRYVSRFLECTRGVKGAQLSTKPATVRPR